MPFIYSQASPYEFFVVLAYFLIRIKEPIDWAIHNHLIQYFVVLVLPWHTPIDELVGDDSQGPHIAQI